MYRLDGLRYYTTQSDYLALARAQLTVPASSDARAQNATPNCGTSETSDQPTHPPPPNLHDTTTKTAHAHTSYSLTLPPFPPFLPAMITSGFTNAPVSQFLVYSTVLGSLLASLTDTRYYLHIDVVPHIWNYGQFWRLLTWQVGYSECC
jgi:hypothetical protein